MTDAIALALIAGTPITIAALGTLWATLRTKENTEVIKGHVNSERTELVGKLEAAKIENRLLREMLIDKSMTASLLAQSAAQAIPSVVLATPIPAPVTEPAIVKSLKHIDENTKSIDENTRISAVIKTGKK